MARMIEHLFESLVRRPWPGATVRGTIGRIDITPLTILRLTPEEAVAAWPELAELAVRSKGSWGYDPGFLAAFRAQLLAPTGLPEGDVLVATRAGRRVGFAVVRTTHQAAWLDDLWVEPDAMGAGVGRALWEAAVERARTAGCTAVELEADPNAEAFYARMGARRVGERPSSITEGRRLPWMRLELGDPAPG
jgi:ribosomal protein S18 acetylase RimI-like enzyme